MESINYRRISNHSLLGGISADFLTEKFSDYHHFILCNICIQILYKPVQCQKCKNKFCLKCINTWYSYNKICPICKHNGTEDIDISFLEQLNEIKFKCFYNSNSCQKISKYSEFIPHIENCEFADYESIIPKCKFKGNLYQIKAHNLNCDCTKDYSKTNQLINDFYSNSISKIVYSKKKNSYNCINGLIFIPEYDYLLVGNSIGELVVINTNLNKIIYEKKGYKYISLLYYSKRSNILFVGTIYGGLYALNLSDFRELFFIKSDHMYVDFLVELNYPIIALSDREDFITIFNYNDLEIKKFMSSSQKINKI